MNDNNDSLPRTRGTADALASAFKTGSIIFIIIALIESLVKICFAIIGAVLGKPIEMLFGKLIPKKEPMTRYNMLPHDPNGTAENFFKNVLPTLPAGEQLMYKKAMELMKKTYNDTCDKNGVK